MIAQPFAIMSVARHAWRQLAFAASTTVFQAAFLAALAACVFIAGGFYDSDFASLDLLWAYLPWVALILVPAFAMRAFSTEGGDRELELMLTMPLSDFEIVAGKWLAGCALLLLTLAFTAPIAVTVCYLGSPDVGAMAAGYLGAALMLMAFYAVSLLAAAHTRDQTSAYVLAVAILAVATLLGSDISARFLGLTPEIADALGRLSPKLNLAQMATGRIELAGLVNFAVVIGLGLWGAAAAVNARRDGQMSPARAVVNSAKILAAVFAGVAVMAAVAGVDFAADLTEQRLYTLHPATLDAVRRLPPGTAIDFYWSEGEPAVPARLRAYAHQTQRLLETLARQSGGNLVLTTHDTQPDSEAEWTALARGIRRVPLSSGDGFLLGLVLRQGDRQRTFAYLDADRSEQIEYDLALALTKLSQAHIPKIGLISPLLTPSNITAPREGLAIVQELMGAYNVAIIPFFADALPQDLDVVIVLGGALLKPGMLLEIDQHVMRGKGLIVCLDPYTRFNPASDAVVPAVTGHLDTIAGLLDQYGIAFEREVTGDTTLAAPVIGADQRTTGYPFWLRLGRAQISAAHPAVASLNELLFVEPGFLTLDPAGSAVSLATTTSQSGILLAADFKGGSPEVVGTKLKPDGVVRTLAAFAGGPLLSPFAGSSGAGPGHLKQSAGPTAVFAVADVDWLFDAASIEGAGTPAARPLNDNHAFLTNMIDVASHDLSLLQIRSRRNLSRRFIRVDELLMAARARFYAEETNATAKIAKVEDTIAKVAKAVKDSGAHEVPANIRGEVDKLKLGLLPVRRQLRDIRRHIREDVESLGRTLTIANLVAGPTLTLIFATMVFRSRRRPSPSVL